MADQKLQMIISADDQASKTLKSVSGNVEQVNKSMSDALQTAGKFGAGVALAVGGLGVMAIKNAAQFETMGVSLKTAFGGSAEAAKKAQDSITTFAAKTPYQLEEVLSSFLKLKNLGLDPSEEALTSYGNTASSMGKSLNQMIEAVADASTGEFERLKEFGIKASSQGDKVSFTFQGVTTTVKKNSEEIQKYLLAIGNTKFAGGMEAQSQTIAGLWSTLADAATIASGSIGQMIIESLNLKEVMKGVGDAMTGVVSWLQSLSPEMQKMIVIGGAAVAGFGAILAVMGAVAAVLPAIMAGFAALGTILGAILSPIGLVVAAVAALAYAWSTNFGGIRDKTSETITEIVAIITPALTWLQGFWKDHGDEVMTVVSWLWNAIKETIVAAIGGILNTIKLFLQLVTGDWSGAWETIKEMVAGAWAWIANAFFGGSETVKNLWSNLWQNVSDIATGFIQGIKDAVTGMVSWITDKIDAALGALRSAKEAVSGWVSSAGSAISGAARSAAAAVGFANGGVIPGGFKAFAHGGIVTQPTLGLVGEGAMNEAVVPLPNGQSIPVQFRNGGQGAKVEMNFGDIHISEKVDAASFFREMEARLTRTLQLQKLGSLA